MKLPPIPRWHLSQLRLDVHCVGWELCAETEMQRFRSQSAQLCCTREPAEAGVRYGPCRLGQL